MGQSNPINNIVEIITISAGDKILIYDVRDPAELKLITTIKPINDLTP